MLQSIARKHCPHRTPESTRELLIEARTAHPRWGPRKLLDYLGPRHPDVSFPAASTAGDILKRAGLVEPRRKKRRSREHPGTSPIQAEAPGDVWTADFKGEFRLGSGHYCYPLTVQDAHSRYLLTCQGLSSTAHDGAQPAFEALFRTHGLPKAIRTDNGLPFASKAICGLSRLNVWWIKLGIGHDRIDAEISAWGCPQQNGRHERMHRTLKAETTRPPEADFPSQQKRFDSFRKEYDELRPHQALDGDVPASRYERTSRRFPANGRLRGPDYPGHTEVRKVSSSGTIKFRSEALFVTSVLEGERVALEETDEGVWDLHFYDVLLGRLDERTGIIHSGIPS